MRERDFLKLEKYHGLGNDYLVFDPGIYGDGCSLAGSACDVGGIIDKDGSLDAAAIRLICDRNYGFGSDGILYGPLFLDAERERISVRIFNPDGSEAEKSGNGVRIFARYLRDFGYVDSEAFTLNTKGGDVEAEYLSNDGGLIKVMMGKATFDSERIPVLLPKGSDSGEAVAVPLSFGGRLFTATCVSMGNPHCVIPMEEISSEAAKSIGPLVECAPYFPNRTNVQFLKVIDNNTIKIEIYERGAGYTLASGSSSCAAACAAHRLGLTARNMTVCMPGGELKIDISPDWRVHMIGEASHVGTFIASRGFLAEIDSVTMESNG